MHVHPEIRRFLLLRIRRGGESCTSALRPRAEMPLKIKLHFSCAPELPAMTRQEDIPELLEQYMAAMGSAEQWVTVREIRAFFNLGDSTGPAFSGFLQRCHYGAFFSCRYKVTRIEKFRDTTPPYRIIRRYLVQERPGQEQPGRVPAKEVQPKTR